MGAKKLAWSLAAVALLVLVFSQLAPRPEPRKYPSRKLVRFWHMWTADWEKVVARICDRYNQSQDEYEVVPLSVPSSTADSKFLIAVAGKNPPDCMAQWNDVIPKWAESKLLLPLDLMMAPDEWQRQKKDIFPAALRVGTYKGHLYGVTVGLNVWALYYRPDLFRIAGLDPDRLPGTLEGLAQWGSKLDQFDSHGGLLRVGFLPWGMRIFAPLFGGGLYDWDKNQVTLDTPSNLRALSWLADSRKRIGFDKLLRFEASQRADHGSDWPFATGSYAMVVDGQWRVEEMRKYAPNLEFRTAALPPPRGGRRHGGFSNGNFMVIPRSAKNSAGAWDFIQFWSGLKDPARAAEFYTWGGWLPLNRKVEQAAAYQAYIKAHPQFQTFVTMLESPNISPIPPVPWQVFLWDRLISAEQAACMGGSTPREAMDKLVGDVNHELAQRKEYGYAD